MSAGETRLNARSNDRSEASSCRRAAVPVNTRRARAAAWAGVLWGLVAITFAGWPSAVRAAADPAECRIVRFSDVGWTDVTSTTAITTELLRRLGYSPRITVLSVPVTFASLADNDIDVFLGNWMPTQEADRRRFIAAGTIDVVRANLVGAKYTLAVPAYTYAAGLTRFADIERFAAPLKNRIYGIEPGNDGNRKILMMLKKNLFGLGNFHLVESSEQGMLAQVARAYQAKQPIVFLAWEPHPMNMRFDLRYLNGGDAVFGPNFGGATVYTVTRAHYLEQCPNVGHLLENLQFSLQGENEMMDAILDRHEQPRAAAAAWLKTHASTVNGWLKGVTTFDGRPAGAAVIVGGPKHTPADFEEWIVAHKIPVGNAVAEMIDAIKAHGTRFFNAVSTAIGRTVDGLTALMRDVSAPVFIVIAALAVWALRRSWGLAVFVALGLLFILNQGYWAETLETLSLVIVSTVLSTLIGVPLGIAAAHRPRLYAAMRPVLDLMQTLPTFVYLIPTLVLFGLGVVPGLISTVIFALPAPIRLTHLGISSVPRPLIEAGEAFGATPAQLLWKVELPSASPTIVTGVTQCIMLSLSMVVIAALVGAGGLGVPVVRALNTVQVGMGFEAGFAIVLLAIILDRVSRPKESGAPR